VGETLLLLLNAHHEAIPFTLPPTRPEYHWEGILDTAATSEPATPLSYAGGQRYPLQGRSLVVLCPRPAQENGQPIPAIQVETPRELTRLLSPTSPGPSPSPPPDRTVREPVRSAGAESRIVGERSGIVGKQTHSTSTP
jgi:glycogen operon protein